jgi:signal transduction histidine kinase
VTQGNITRHTAWAAPVVLVGILATNAWLAARNDTVGAPSDLVWLLAFATFAVVGGFVARAQPRNPIGWLFLGAGLGTPLASMLTDLSRLLDAPAVEVVAMICFGIAWLLAGAYPLLLFPDGHLPSRRWVPLVVAVTVLAVVQSVAVLLGAWSLVSVFEYASLVPIVLAIASLVLRWRRSDGIVRRQLSWLALGGLVIVLLIAVEFWLAAVLGHSDDRGAYLEAAAVSTVPIATAVAILRHRLFDIEVVLRRSIVYSALTAVVIAAYAGSLAVATHLLDASASAGVSLVVTAIVAVALQPVKERLDRGVEWALFGDRHRPERPLAALGARLETVRTDDAMVEAAQTVRAALRLRYVRIELTGDFTPVEAGRPSANPVVVDLVSHGVVEGRLLAGRRAPGDEFDARERALLGDLCRQVALVAGTIRLTADLRRSRERLVHAREQERMRLRRDLHDGLGPVLAGLTLQVDALRDRVEPAVDQSTMELLDRIKTELRRCVADVRRAVDGLRPADLDELGLAGVVGEQARSLSASGVVVAVHCGSDLTVGPAAEVAAYRIVTEAMTNVVRHAEARTCWVTIARAGSGLEIRVSDDGRGMDAAAVPGVGLRSMRDRADELGGILEVTPRSGGGTDVRALIPGTSAVPAAVAV